MFCAALTLAATLLGRESVAAAQNSSPPTTQTGREASGTPAASRPPQPDPDRSGTPAASRPPQTGEHYIQYGVGFAAETVAYPGAVCPSDASAPCILGSGAGLAIRVGYRTHGPWYIGGAYEFSRQDPSNLLRLAILQQLRADARYYLDRTSRLVPYIAGSFGGAAYGNEWGWDTVGITAMLGAGVEFQVSRTTLVGAALGYRPFVFRKWVDGADQVRADALFGFGVAHLISLELLFEVRDPLPRW